MRIISKSRLHFRGTHKGHEIEIDREPPGEPGRFYIRVWSVETGLHGYDGWSPEGVTTLAEAKREALCGAGLKERPSSNLEKGAPQP